MYDVSGCKGRDLTLQESVIHVTFMLHFHISYYFCLTSRKRYIALVQQECRVFSF